MTVTINVPDFMNDATVYMALERYHEDIAVWARRAGNIPLSERCLGWAYFFRCEKNKAATRRETPVTP
jgi:hypothetical protein